MPTQSVLGWGELCALGSAIAWAFGVILYKRLGERLSPVALNLRKNLIVLAGFVPLLLTVHGPKLPALSATDVVVCLLSGLIGIGFADTLYFRALNRIGAGRMAVVGNLYSPLVLFFAFVFLDERLNAAQLLGFALVTGGVLLVADPGRAQGLSRAQLWRGVLLGVASVVLVAVAIVMVKRVLERADLLWVSALRLLGGLLALSLTALRGGGLKAEPLDRRGLALLLLAALVGQLLSMLLWLAGFKYTTASVAAVLNESSSVFIVLLAWLFLHEPLSARRALGVVCTLSGVALMLVR